jgi:hypothetical protein
VVYNTLIFDTFLHLLFSVQGDFNLGHMDWEILSVFSGKADQQFLDIVNDNSLTQVVNKTTRKDNTLDLILTNHPATVNKVET